jgi:hypothetical protein
MSGVASVKPYECWSVALIAPPRPHKARGACFGRPSDITSLPVAKNDRLPLGRRIHVNHAFRVVRPASPKAIA